MQNFIPNVRIIAVAISLAVGLPGVGHAAYTVIEDEAVFKEKPVVTSEAFTVPFFLGKSKLGPKGKEALRKIQSAAQQGQRIEVIGRGDKEQDLVTASKRAEAITQWLVANGVPASSVSLRTDNTIVRENVSSVFLSSVRIESVTKQLPLQPTPPSSFVIAESTNEMDQPKPWNEALIQAILEQFKNGEIDSEKAGQLLAMASPSGQPKQKASQLKFAMDKTSWTLRKGLTLQQNLENWVKEAGWKSIEWSTQDHYDIAETRSLQGNLLDVISELSKVLPGLDFEINKTKKTIVVRNH